MKTTHRIINGDSRLMKELEDGTVDLVITSPPYWQLKDYGTKGEIGFYHSYEEYINNLNLVWSEAYRVLDSGCRLCINIGDQYARSVYYGRYKVIPIRTEIIKFCETIGFDYMGAIVWQKVATTNTTGGATIMGSFPYPRNGILKLDYEHILIFKKVGQSTKNIDKLAKSQSKMTTEEWNTYFSGHWNFIGEKQKKHLAMFPLELPTRLIKMFSFVGETVLDPFLGSGTTSLAAMKLHRNSVGYEINPEFLPIISEKLQQQKVTPTTPEYIIFSKQKKISQKSINAKIKKLPYIFKDPMKLDKKINLKGVQFGSKIDKNSKEREKYYSVKQIISPELLLLNEEKKIKLIGIKENPEKREQALEYLRNKVKGQRVFLKFDQLQIDENGYSPCYLYLKNKTFVNARLLREKLVEVDDSYQYKHKKKFLQISKEE